MKRKMLLLIAICGVSLLTGCASSNCPTCGMYYQSPCQGYSCTDPCLTPPSCDTSCGGACGDVLANY